MDNMETTVRKIVDELIRPRVRVDGGDIKFEGMNGDTVHVGAYADCATCPCCEGEFSHWIAARVRTMTDLEVRVSITKHVPYYAR